MDAEDTVYKTVLSMWEMLLNYADEAVEACRIASPTFCCFFGFSWVGELFCKLLINSKLM